MREIFRHVKLALGFILVIIKKYLYASRDSEEKIVADEKGIQEAIND